MNRYNIRIDGEVAPQSYTYEELLLNDILDFDDIEVKHESQPYWTTISEFYFPEEHDNESANSNGGRNYIIDEYGQVVSNYNIGGGSKETGGSSSSTTTPSTTQTTTTTSRRTSSSTDNEGWKIFWKIFLTLAVIGIFIALTPATGWGSVPIGAIAVVTLRQIWKD